MRKLLVLIMVLVGCGSAESTSDSETVIVCNATHEVVFDGELSVLYDGFVQGVLEEGGDFYNYFVTFSGGGGTKPMVLDPTNNDVERSWNGYKIVLTDEFAKKGIQTDCLELVLTRE